MVIDQSIWIVGLAAAESQNPDESVPKACKSVTFRIVALYLVPILLIIMILPFRLASDNEPVFATVMKYYNMGPFGIIFSAVVLVAAFSCANTGFYGTVRCMFGLSIEGLAPKFLSKVNKQGNPRTAVLWTLAFMWVVLIIGLISQLTGALGSLYATLLSLSGFTGSVAWIGISISWVVFRKRLKANGYDPETCLKAKVQPGQKWIPVFSFIVQIMCLMMLAFQDLKVFFIAMCAIFLPMIGYRIAKSSGKLRDESSLAQGEKTFEELFPPLK